MKEYTPYIYGRITKMEAGCVYRAMKNGNITVKPETTKTLYNEADAYEMYRGQFAERYNEDSLYYDRIYAATQAILNDDFETAQNELEAWENDRIARASKKSMWAKYTA